jgi:hypothetical protein
MRIIRLLDRPVPEATASTAGGILTGDSLIRCQRGEEAFASRLLRFVFEDVVLEVAEGEDEGGLLFREVSYLGSVTG